LREGERAGRPRTLDAKQWRGVQGDLRKTPRDFAWRPRSGRSGLVGNICVADTAWIWGCASVSDSFDKWNFGYASRALKSLNRIR